MIESSSSKDNEKTDDNTLTINVSKIFSFFKKKKEQEPVAHEGSAGQESGTNDGFAVDTNKIAHFLKKNYIWLLIIIPIILSIQFRMAPASLAMTDEWARNNVNNFIKQDIANFVSQNYPNLPAAKSEKLVNEELAKALTNDIYPVKTGQYKGKSISISAEMEKISNDLKEFWQYENNGKKFTYMPDIDPYTYLRYARNYLEKGQTGDTVKDGKQWDNHMIAPIGAPVTQSIHPYVLAWIHKILSIFRPSSDLMNNATFFPIIFSALAVIPAFFIGRKLGGNVGGLVAAIMVAIHPAILSRTTWGHADTDAYNAFFPLLITWLFFEGFDAKKRWLRYTLPALSGFFVGVYTQAWAGWWYIFDFMIATMAVSFAYAFWTNRKNIRQYFEQIKKPLGIVILFLLSSGLFVTLFFGFKSFIDAPFNPLSFSNIKAAAKPTLWPNVYTTVAELNPASLEQIISNSGGKLFFIIALAGILFMLAKKDNEGRIDLKYFALMTIWFAASMYASTKGVRFTLLLAPAFSIAFGTALGKAYRYATNFGQKSFHISNRITAPIILALFFLLLFGPAKSWYESTINDVPIVNDAWWNTLTKINAESKPDAIINSWWDFGHHFKYISDRAVTFDGQTQNSPAAHWIGRVLVTDNEEEAIGILRMLDCGNHKGAFNAINNQLSNETSRSVMLLRRIMMMNKADAEKVLEEEGFGKDIANDILNKSHCIPPEDYFITSDDMIGKAGVWSHFGLWNFDRAKAWLMRNEPKETVVNDLTKNNNLSAEEAEQLYEEASSIGEDESKGNSWISSWPSYVSNVASCSQKGTLLDCGSGIKIDLATMNVTLSLQQGTFQPASVAYVYGPDVVEKKFESPLDVSVALMPTQEGGYNVLLLQKPLAMSLFTRLYFFKGHGLKYFKPFYAQGQISGGAIYTWKIDWEGKEKNRVYAKEEKVGEEKNTPPITEENTTTNVSLSKNSTNKKATNFTKKVK